MTIQILSGGANPLTITENATAPRTYTFADVSGTISPIVSGTAVATTSGTFIDFTGIPSWVKRITVMFNGVSTNGTSFRIIQIGSGSVTASGYSSGGSATNSTSGSTSSTIGYLAHGTFASAVDAVSGQFVITLLGGNTYIGAGTASSGGTTCTGSGTCTLAGILDRVRLTTVNGTDLFDAGSINILFE